MNLTSLYNLESLGAAERVVGLIKAIMFKTKEEGLSFDKALTVFKNIRNESGYSPIQLFYLRYWRDRNLLNVQDEPAVEEMAKAKDRIRFERKINKDKLTKSWPMLHLGDLVRGQHPKTKEWSMKGEVVELVHGKRSVNVMLADDNSRLFMREDVRLDSTKRYQEDKEELAETRRRPRRARQAPNSDQGEQRRSLRLAKKKVTMGEEKRSHNPVYLPYYMEAVEQGHAGMWNERPKYGLKDSEETDSE